MYLILKTVFWIIKKLSFKMIRVQLQFNNNNNKKMIKDNKFIKTINLKRTNYNNNSNYL